MTLLLQGKYCVIKIFSQSSPHFHMGLVRIENTVGNMHARQHFIW